jgi:lipopolysaccharide heptosyltransferase I
LKVLISRLSSMGDVVCTMGAAGSIRQAVPEAEIHWAVDPRFAALVERCRHVDRVIRIKPGLAAYRAFWKSAELYDAALDLQGLLKSALVIAGVKAERKLGFHWQREGARLFSAPVLPDPSSLHVVDQYIDVARAIGGEESPADFGLVPSAEDIEQARELALEAAGRPWAVLNAGAGWAAKRWSPASYAHAANAIHEAGGAAVFIGAEDGRQAFQEVREAGAEHAVDLIGRTNLGQLVGLISQAALHIGGDTGSSHIAAALGRPCIGLYTQTRPERCCPYGQIHRCRSLDPVRVSEQAAGIIQDSKST